EYKPEILNLKKTIKQIKVILNRYHYKVSGFYLDDDKWIFYDENSDYYSLVECFLIENTIDKYYIGDIETKKYLNRLLEHLNNVSYNFVAEMNISDKCHNGKYIITVIF